MYCIRGGVSHSPVESTKEGYSATIVYENAEGRRNNPGQGADHGSGKHRSYPRITGNATITGAMGAGVSASRDTGDTFSKTLMCHASNGRFLSPIRNSIPPMRLILSGPTFEAWADIVFQPEQYFLAEGG